MIVIFGNQSESSCHSAKCALSDSCKFNVGSILCRGCLENTIMPQTGVYKRHVASKSYTQKRTASPKTLSCKRFLVKEAHFQLSCYFSDWDLGQEVPSVGTRLRQWKNLFQLCSEVPCIALSTDLSGNWRSGPLVSINDDTNMWQGHITNHDNWIQLVWEEVDVMGSWSQNPLCSIWLCIKYIVGAWCLSKLSK